MLDKLVGSNSLHFLEISGSTPLLGLQSIDLQQLKKEQWISIFLDRDLFISNNWKENNMHGNAHTHLLVLKITSCNNII